MPTENLRGCVQDPEQSFHQDLVTQMAVEQRPSQRRRLVDEIGMVPFRNGLVHALSPQYLGSPVREPW
ncbi:MAG TPA: hypothetical protein VGH89_04200 [Pseudonocardia sp.]